MSSLEEQLLDTVAAVGYRPKALTPVISAPTLWRSLSKLASVVSLLSQSKPRVIDTNQSLSKLLAWILALESSVGTQPISLSGEVQSLWESLTEVLEGNCETVSHKAIKKATKELLLWMGSDGMAITERINELKEFVIEVAQNFVS